MYIEIENIEIKTAYFSPKLNYKLLPVTRIDDLEIYNKIVQRFREDKSFTQFVNRTESGGISCKDLVYRLPCFSSQMHNCGVELIVLHFDYCFRLQFLNGNMKIKLSGTKAYKAFKKECKKDGVKLEDYFISNGEELNKTLPKPIIELNFRYKDLVLTNCHHLDLNSSYTAGIVESFPALATTCNRIYKNRKRNEKNKLILNASIGYFHSKFNGFKLTHFALAAYEYTNRRINEMRQELISKGCNVIAINTDGIWYQGPIWKSEDPNYDYNKMGNFKIDHRNCMVRFKSKGAYEYIENGNYTPVIRGRTALEEFKPRTDWQWGDIYKTNGINVLKLDEKTGLIEKETLSDDILL